MPRYARIVPYSGCLVLSFSSYIDKFCQYSLEHCETCATHKIRGLSSSGLSSRVSGERPIRVV
jgi:hypothetical protein